MPVINLYRDYSNKCFDSKSHHWSRIYIERVSSTPSASACCSREMVSFAYGTWGLGRLWTNLFTTLYNLKFSPFSYNYCNCIILKLLTVINLYWDNSNTSDWPINQKVNAIDSKSYHWSGIPLKIRSAVQIHWVT